jgi:hypothetical protein
MRKSVSYELSGYCRLTGRGRQDRCFHLVPRDSLLTKVPETGVELRVVKSIKNFLSGRSQRIRIDGHLSEQIRLNSGVPQGSVIGPLLFLTYVNNIWRNTECNVRLFQDECIIYRIIYYNRHVDKLQTDLNKLGNGPQKMKRR